MIAHRCERNLAGPEEDCGRHVAYVPCGRSAQWHIEEPRSAWSHHLGWWACDDHATEALLDENEVTHENGEPMTLDSAREFAGLVAS